MYFHLIFLNDEKNKMNKLFIFFILNAFQFHYGQFVAAKKKTENYNKSFREIEPITTMLLDNESYSIISKPQRPMDESNAMFMRRKGDKIGNKFLPSAVSQRHHKDFEKARAKKHHFISSVHQQPEKINDAVQNDKLSNKNKEDALSHNHMKNFDSPKKKLHKRHFELQNRHHNTASKIRRNKAEDNVGSTYLFDLTETTEAPKNDCNQNQTKGFTATERNFSEKLHKRHFELQNRHHNTASKIRRNKAEDVVGSTFVLPETTEAPKSNWNQNQTKGFVATESNFNEKLHKRNFELQNRHHNTGSKIRRNKAEDVVGSTYGFMLTETTKAPKNNWNQNQIKGFAATERNFNGKFSTNNKNEFFESLNTNPWANAEHRTTNRDSESLSSDKPNFVSLTPAKLDSENFKRDSFPDLPENDRNTPNSMMLRNMATNSYGYDQALRYSDNGGQRTTVTPPVQTLTFRQADIVQRNLAASTLTGYDTDSDDADINFDITCDQLLNQSCWVQREIGDVVTLAVKINSPKKSSSFQIRWIKVYQNFDSNKGKPLELEAGKLPWNMVSGSEGKELRLNPVDNSDTDPNCFVAKVFSIKKNHGKMLFSELKKLVFRIEVSITDMGKIYAGEELSINIENFVSLPERGNLLFQWYLETKPHQYESLPSNIKMSNSGRSVVLKELKKGRLGVLNCVIYSSSRYAVAKRRFNILNIENMKRRAVVVDAKDDPMLSELLRNRRCRHLIRRSQEKAKQRLAKGRKPISRVKRYKRMQSRGMRSSDIDCESLGKKVYSRWVRSLFGDYTTEDPRLMPLEKLFELSEEGDGTLDNIIPHEIHYVDPKVELISGTSEERSVDHHVSTNCTDHFDCGENAICIFPEEETNSTIHIGNCYCRPEFYKDGTVCRKIPASNHREKRLKRNARNDFAVPQHLFYENSREIQRSTPQIVEVTESTETSKVLAFEEEESFLLSDCIDDKDCSMHAKCVQPANGHPYCKCRPGYRGNGIFCWETIDYVPPEEQFLTDEELNAVGQGLQPEIPIDRLAVKTAEPQEIEDV